MPPDMDPGGGGPRDSPWSHRALIAAYLRRCHRTDLREVAPGFSTTDEVLDDINVHRLIAEFSDYSEAIVAVVDVEQVINDAPF